MLRIENLENGAALLIASMVCFICARHPASNVPLRKAILLVLFVGHLILGKVYLLDFAFGPSGATCDPIMTKSLVPTVLLFLAVTLWGYVTKEIEKRKSP